LGAGARNARQRNPPVRTSGSVLQARSLQAWLSRRCEGRDMVEATGRERWVRDDSTISPRAPGRNRTCAPGSGGRRSIP
jgi:hypothetical protein